MKHKEPLHQVEQHMVPGPDFERAVDLCENATPGPWWYRDAHHFGEVTFTECIESRVADRVIVGTGDGTGAIRATADDIEFIIHARDLLPQALHTIRALWERLEEADAAARKAVQGMLNATQVTPVHAEVEAFVRGAEWAAMRYTSQGEPQFYETAKEAAVGAPQTYCGCTGPYGSVNGRCVNCKRIVGRSIGQRSEPLPTQPPYADTPPGPSPERCSAFALWEGDPDHAQCILPNDHDGEHRFVGQKSA